MRYELRATIVFGIGILRYPISIFFVRDRLCTYLPYLYSYANWLGFYGLRRLDYNRLIGMI